jgi:acyl carrier protein
MPAFTREEVDMHVTTAIANHAGNQLEVDDPGRTLDALALDSLDTVELGLTIQKRLGLDVWDLPDWDPAATVARVKDDAWTAVTSRGWAA